MTRKNEERQKRTRKEGEEEKEGRRNQEGRGWTGQEEERQGRT